MSLQIEPIQRALPYLTLRECVEYATTNKAIAAAVQRTIAAKGVEWGLGGADESEEVLLGKVRALWSELPLFALYAPASMQYGDARPRGKEATLLALRALPLSDLVTLFSHPDYQLIAKEIAHVQRSVLAGSHGGDVERESVRIALNGACNGNNCDVVSFLLDCCPEEASSYVVPWRSFSSMACHVQLMELLSKKNARTVHNLSEDGSTPLHHAAGRHCLEAVRFLLARGANPNAEAREKKTPLDYLFVQNRQLYQFESEITAALLEGGADPNHVNAEGVFPLIATAHHTITELLLRHGACIEQQTEHGKRALHLLSQAPQCIALLLRCGASPHCVDKKGRTPLHDAVKYSVERSIELLFDAGSRLDQKANDGRDAFDLAQDHPTILTLLRCLHQRGHLVAAVPSKLHEGQEKELQEQCSSPSPVFQIDALVQMIFSYCGVADWTSLSRLSQVARSASVRLMAQRAREWGVAAAHETEAQRCAALRALWEELLIVSLFVPVAVQREIRRTGREAFLDYLRTLPFAHCARLLLQVFYMRDASPHVQHVEASLFAASHPEEAEEERLKKEEVRELFERAVYFHRLEVVRFLIAYGALKNVTIQSDDGYRALDEDLSITTLLLDHHILTLEFRTAIRGGHVALASLLFQRGADPNEGALDAETPPLLLLTERFFSCSRLIQVHSLTSALLKAGADPHSADDKDLHAHDPIQLRLLLDHGAEVDQRNRKGETFLYRLVYSGGDWWGSIALLLQRGADPNATNLKGRRPLDIATRPEIIELLQAAGATRGQPGWPW